MSEENVFLLHAFASGVLITFIYDILRIWRRVAPHKGLLVSLEDLAFWLFCAFYIIQLMHQESNGQERICQTTAQAAESGKPRCKGAHVYSHSDRLLERMGRKWQIAQISQVTMKNKKNRIF